MDWNALFSAALVNGVWLSLTLVVIMVISSYVALDMWVGDYPPDIREKYGPMSDRAKRARPYFAVAVFLAVFVVPILGLTALHHQLGTIGYLAAFVFGGTAVFVFNLFDLLILDWLLFCTVRPRMMVLPGTEGMAGYRNYRFHAVGFLKGLGFCLVGGLLIAFAWMVLSPLLV